MHNNSLHPSIDELGLDVQPATSTNYAIQTVLSYLFIGFTFQFNISRPSTHFRKHHMTQNAILIGQIPTTLIILSLIVGHIP